MAARDRLNSHLCDNSTPLGVAAPPDGGRLRLPPAVAALAVDGEQRSAPGCSGWSWSQVHVVEGLVKAEVGFEPTNNGFAIRPIRPLWHLYIFVELTGLEPATSTVQV